MFLLFLVFQISCTTEPEGDYTDFRVKVDKITLPDTISVADTLSIKFDGIIGSDDCSSFKLFEAYNNSSNEIEITVWGTRPNYPSACPAVIVELRGKEYKTIFSNVGLYKIKVHQPNNTFLIATLYVK